MGRAEASGLVLCILATVLMGLKPLALYSYHAGLGIMALGLAVLMLHHFFDLVLILKDPPGSHS